jgi:hypothetical protein
MRVRLWKLLCALAGSLFAGYYSVELLAHHVADHIPISTGTLLCLLLFVSVPTIGYVLLFMPFPRAGRLLKRQLIAPS